MLYSCHKAPGSLQVVGIVLLSCLSLLSIFGRDPNPLFHSLTLSSSSPLLLFSPLSPLLLHHLALSFSLSVVPFVAFA